MLKLVVAFVAVAFLVTEISACNYAAMETCATDMLADPMLWFDPCSVYQDFKTCYTPYKPACVNTDMWRSIQSDLSDLDSLCP